MNVRTETAMTAKQVSDLLLPSESMESSVREGLATLNPEAIFADGLDAALIGYSVSGEECVAVYDIDKCVKIIMKTHEMDEKDAEDFFSYNILRGADCGENAPIFILIPD